MSVVWPSRSAASAARTVAPLSKSRPSTRGIAAARRRSASGVMPWRLRGVGARTGAARAARTAHVAGMHGAQCRASCRRLPPRSRRRDGGRPRPRPPAPPADGRHQHRQSPAAAGPPTPADASAIRIGPHVRTPPPCRQLSPKRSSDAPNAVGYANQPRVARSRSSRGSTTWRLPFPAPPPIASIGSGSVACTFELPMPLP